MILQCGFAAQFYVAPEAGAPMERRPSIRVMKGRGIVDDRYSSGAGFFTDAKRTVIKHVTFIEMEAIEGARTDRKRPLPNLLPEYTRRNIVTCGVALNHMIDREFMTSRGVFFRGIELAEPCERPAKLAHEQYGRDIIGFKETMRHRGGIRAEVLTDGIIEEGDTIIFMA
ncbi:MAG: hypothetical protein HY455_03240 [Parcubacteria group bacterium]|nr:hypothetical protein [Parcubacteria group bacterium]